MPREAFCLLYWSVANFVITRGNDYDYVRRNYVLRNLPEVRQKKPGPDTYNHKQEQAPCQEHKVF
jgi:hypothetical protein